MVHRSLSFRMILMILLAPGAFALGGCWSVLPSAEGGQTSFRGERAADPADIALPEGYRAEVVATGLTYPTGVTFDGRGGIYVLLATGAAG